jgi:hypothetical protein
MVEAILQQIFDRTAVVRIPGFPDANAIARLANLALKRYNADHPVCLPAYLCFQSRFLFNLLFIHVYARASYSLIDIVITGRS